MGRRASPSPGRDPAELLEALEPRRGPERVLDFMLRAGPYGDGFGAEPDGLTLDVLERTPHGIDLGPLEPRLPEVLRTPSGKVELAPEPIVADVDRLRAALARERNGGMVLIGRRQLRSNNSWMHNLPALVKGKDRCTLHIHPDDAERLGLGRRRAARRQLGRRRGRGAGRGDRRDHARRRLDPARLGPRRARRADGRGGDHAGVNSNVLADESQVDPLSGNAVLNGIPVEVRAVSPAGAPESTRSAEHGAAAVAADDVRGV